MKRNLKCLMCTVVLTGLAVILTGTSANLISAQPENGSPSDSASLPSAPILYFVDSTGDGGNGGSATTCNDGTGHCTLRAAMEAANANPGLDGIDIGIPLTDPGCNATTGQCIINLTRALPNILEGVAIDGPNPALLTVRRDSGLPEFRIFDVTTSDTVRFSGMTISGGVADSGGGIRNSFGGTVNVTHCTVSENGVDGFGGGIANFGSTMNITESTITDNVGHLGGGIANQGSMNINRSTISFNFAYIGFGSFGGGIRNGSGTLNITNSTIYENFANAFGGAIFNAAAATVNLTNSTIVGNDTSGGGQFGGLAGGIYNETMTVNVKNSIIALNNAPDGGPDVYGNFASFGYNLIGITSGGFGFSAATDQTGTTASPLDPEIVFLHNYGGPTQTVALDCGSPALDRGSSSGLTGNLITDQRGPGFLRTVDEPLIPNATDGDGTDIGAYEAQPCGAATPTPTPAPTATPTPTPTPTPTCPPITVKPATLPNGILGRPYNKLFTATGGNGPHTFSVSDGSLPPGLNLAIGGALSGTPTTEGNFEFTILATDRRGCTGKRHYWVSFKCPTITLSPSTFPRAVVGHVYSRTMTASNGTAPYNFVVLSGGLPPGLSLSSGGVLSGIPTRTGTYQFYIDVKDAYGCFTIRSYNLVVARN